MKVKRPVNLDLTKFHFPIMAILSILHRVSGVLLFFALPFWLYLLQQSLVSAESFANVQVLLTHSGIQFFLWITLSALAYHLVAGVRHLLMDIGIGEHLPRARHGAWFTLGVAVVLILLAGVWIW